MLSTRARAFSTSAALLLTLVVSALAVPSYSASAAGPPESGAPPSPARAADSALVTLITGDVVRLDTGIDGHSSATVVRQVNPREGMHTFSSGGDVYVEPESASPLLASGKLDEQLFNVSGLVRQGYDDEHRRSIPLILGYDRRDGLAAGQLAATAPPRGSETQSVLSSVGALAVAESKADAHRFWTDLTDSAAGPSAGLRPHFDGRVARVWLDGQVRATLDESVPQIGAPSAWARGYDGKGVQVAVLDTGIDPTHPDFAGRIGDSRDFTGSGSTVDHSGHGTHVASILAGSGAASEGRYTGVAPKARLMVGKVLDDDGTGQASWAIDGMEWAASHGAEVVNLSLGGAVTKGEDPLSRSVDALTAQYGTLFVVAAGNSSFGQPGTKDVTAPGAAAAALTVGAVSKRDSFWSGSRNGLMGDAAIKPDLVAPGVNITAARAAGTGWGDSPYTSMTGTSMAAPHVAGSAAILKEEHPSWTADRLKAVLVSTAQPLPGETVFKVGSGRVDVDRATRQQVSVDHGLIDLGYFARPYDPARMHPTRELTYTNDSDVPVTLHLATTLVNRRGAAAPAGALTVSPSTLTVDPGAKATAELTLDATSVPADTYTGRVTATGPDGLRADTAIGFYKQDDTVDVTFRALDRHGEPAIARLRVAPYKHADGRYYPDNIYLTPEQKEWTLRLPEGDYNLFGLVSTLDGSGRWVEESSVVGDPRLKVAAPNFTVTLDARTAKPVTLETPKESAPRQLTFEWWRGDPANPISTYDYWGWSFVDGQPEKISVAPTEHVDDAPFDLVTSWESGVPQLQTRLVGRGADLPVDALQQGGPLIDGDHTYQVADAGVGTPAQLQGAGASGKVALVRESSEASYGEQVRAAADAGAAAVMLYSAKPGAFYPSVGGRIPVLSVTREVGQRIRALAAGPQHLDLRLSGTPRTPYAYDLTFVERQQIHDGLDYRVKPRELARVDNRIYTTGTQEAGWMVHQTQFAGCSCSAPEVSDYIPQTGYTRTDYITADQDLSVFPAWQFQLGFPADLLFSRDAHTYEPGQRTSEDWLKAPLSPGVANGSVAPFGRGMQSQRWGDFLSYDIAGLTDAAGHWSPQLSGTDVHSRLYVGDEMLHSSDRLLRGSAEVPDEPRTYRLEADVDHDGSVVGLSTRTHTVWTFRSSSSDGVDGHSVLPLIDVDYPDIVDAASDRNALDLTNTAATGQRVTLQLRADHQNGSITAPIDALSVWTSYDDGTTWEPAIVRRTGLGSFEATYRHPQAGEYVSLRVRASDTAGNTLQQSLIHAYRLDDRASH